MKSKDILGPKPFYPRCTKTLFNLNKCLTSLSQFHRSSGGVSFRTPNQFRVSINSLRFFCVFLGPASFFFALSLIYLSSFIKRSLLSRACLPSFRCQERSPSELDKKLSLSDYVAILLPVAISCRAAFRPNSRRQESEGDRGSGSWMDSPTPISPHSLLALTQATIYSVLG